MKVLITTTINVPTVLTKWAATMNPGDCIIVAGDLKSPHVQITDLLATITERFSVATEYLHPDDQKKWKISEHLWWNCIQRRNLALLRAMQLNPEYIITIDDDNYPTSYNQLDELIEIVANPPNDIDTVASPTGWYNPGSVCSPVVTHRGFPLSLRHVAEANFILPPDDLKIGVGAMLWSGDPDIDAIERICHDPEVIEVEYDTVVPPKVWAPFNSQATLYRSEVAPLMFMWPFIGRYDDIWSSYLARHIMDHFRYSVYYGHPVVRQERNEHNLMNDLTNEMFGMTFTDEFVAIIQEIDLSSVNQEPSLENMINALKICFKVLSEVDFIPSGTKESFFVWIDELNVLKEDLNG